VKKEFLIVSGVLLPFFALLALGFWFTRGEALVTQNDIPVQQRELVPEAPDAPSPTFPPGPRPELAAQSAPVRAVAPQVRQCFKDLRAPIRQTVEVDFVPLADGGFAQVRVHSQNPYVVACIEDVFDEVRWAPTDDEKFEPTSATFSFDPSAD
jgi:hypothetical protein